MTDSLRTERIVREWLADSAQAGVPDWFDELIATTARTPQRPAWSIPERWIPMATFSRVIAPARHVPWRAVSLLAVLLLLLAAAVALYAGSSSRLPPAFGPAAPGLVAFGSDGDILAIEPRTGRSRTVVGGPEFDSLPVYSLDGRLLAFIRQDHDVVVAGNDGSGLVTVASGLVDPFVVGFSADAGLVLVQDVTLFGIGTLWVARADGTESHQLPIDQLGISADDASFRPADGRQIVFRGSWAERGQGIYVIDVDGTNLTTLVEPDSVGGMGTAQYSPNGRRITYNRWSEARSITSQQHVMAADGSGEVVLPLPSSAVWQNGGQWSNDSTRLLMKRGRTGSIEGMTLAVAPADGSSTGVEIGEPPRGLAWDSAAWAPDDSLVIGALANPSGTIVRHVLWDPKTGEVTEGWPADSEPSWQRVASPQR